MSSLPKTNAHVVDVLGNVIGRDQPILRMDKAIEMVSLLSPETFLNENVVFFDPFCKAGELLLACAYMSCVSMMKRQSKLMDVKEIYREIFESNRYFALAPDERHHRLSLRTFLGNAKSHDEKYNRIIRNGNYLSETNGRLNKEVFEKEFGDMIEYIKEKSDDKEIIAVGNPPYQEEDGGYGKSAKSIYNYFATSLMESKDIKEFILVIPGRWFSGGKGLDEFRERIIESQQIKQIRYFENPHEIFPTVEIRGGICFLYWAKNFTGRTTIDNGVKSKKIALSNYDIVVPHVEALSIIQKVLNKSSGFVSNVAWPIKPFGLRGYHFDRNAESTGNPKDIVECICKGRNIKKIKKCLVPKNADRADEYQVAFPKSSGGGKGKRDKILPRPGHFFILEKGQISTETYSVIHSFKKRIDAENFILFLKTYLARFLFGLRKPTQDAKSDTFSWVPLMNVKTKWCDQKIFNYFEITEEEQKYIREKVDYWTA